ncbi:MAG: hypothetical protein KME27_30695 [Lyngbya sp. HA4199-MV5]|nr:hypothetical protein [Lyngbya sp. HA4199-MV5]
MEVIQYRSDRRQCVHMRDPIAPQDDRVPPSAVVYAISMSHDRVPASVQSV